MDPASFCPNQSKYLVSNTKFWEIINEGSMNLIRYGKIKDGVEHDVKSGYSDYDSTQEAVSRALALIEAKQSNGYILDSPESKRLILKSPIKTPVKNRFTNLMSVKDNFDGVYLELELDNRILFWKIQASGPSIKIDIGVDGKLEKTDFNRFDSDEEAAKMVKLKVWEKLANGYKRNETKFIKDHIRTPRIQNLQNAVDVLIEDEKPKTSHRRLFQNEKLTIGLPENAIEDMLDSIGLKNYANIFAEERISVEDFLTLSDKDLEGLNVTFEARKLISQCTASGIWDISKANKF